MMMLTVHPITNAANSTPATTKAMMASTSSMVLRVPSERTISRCTSMSVDKLLTVPVV
jgi:hypothetical protein